MFTPQQPFERVNMLIRISFWMVALCLVVIVWSPQLGLDDFAKGAITLILGRFLGYTDNIYAYEFGTTRAEKAKDQTITQLAKEATPPMSAEKVDVAAETVNVTEETPK